MDRCSCPTNLLQYPDRTAFALATLMLSCLGTALHVPSAAQEGNGVLACAGWPVAGRRVGAENDEEGETEVDPIFVFIMNDRNCQAALAVPGAPVGSHNDPHIAMGIVKYIVQEMSLLVGFPMTEKHLIRRSTGPPSTYDYWCVHTLIPRQAKVFQDRLEDYFTTGPPGQVPPPVQPPPAQVQTSQWSSAVKRNGHTPIGAVYIFGGSERPKILHGLLARGAFRP